MDDDVFNVVVCDGPIALRRCWVADTEVLNFRHCLLEFAHEELESCEGVDSFLFGPKRTAFFPTRPRTGSLPDPTR